MNSQSLLYQVFSTDQSERLAAALLFNGEIERAPQSFWQDGQGKTSCLLQVMWIVTHADCCLVVDNRGEIRVPAGLKLDLSALLDWLGRMLKKEPIIIEWYPHLQPFAATDIKSWSVVTS